MKINLGFGSNVVIDGKSFSGSNISIQNGRVIVDGVVQDGSLTGDINVVVHGNINTLENNCGNVTAHDVGEISTGSGDVSCQNVSGSIRTGSGDVTCGNVGGSIKTGSGDVSHR